MNRNPNRTGLIGQSARNTLSDPPCGIGTEFESLPVLISLGRLHQSDIAFLDQVEQGEASPRIMFGHVHDQSEIATDQFILGRFEYEPCLLYLNQRAGYLPDR